MSTNPSHIPAGEPDVKPDPDAITIGEHEPHAPEQPDSGEVVMIDRPSTPADLAPLRKYLESQGLGDLANRTFSDARKLTQEAASVRGDTTRLLGTDGQAGMQKLRQRVEEVRRRRFATKLFGDVQIGPVVREIEQCIDEVAAACKVDFAHFTNSLEGLMYTWREPVVPPTVMPDRSSFANISDYVVVAGEYVAWQLNKLHLALGGHPDRSDIDKTVDAFIEQQKEYRRLRDIELAKTDVSRPATTPAVDNLLQHLNEILERFPESIEVCLARIESSMATWTRPTIAAAQTTPEAPDFTIRFAGRAMREVDDIHQAALQSRPGLSRAAIFEYLRDEYNIRYSPAEPETSEQPAELDEPIADFDDVFRQPQLPLPQAAAASPRRRSAPDRPSFERASSGRASPGPAPTPEPLTVSTEESPLQWILRGPGNRRGGSKTNWDRHSRDHFKLINVVLVVGPADRRPLSSLGPQEAEMKLRLDNTLYSMKPARYPYIRTWCKGKQICWYQDAVRKNETDWVAAGRTEACPTCAARGRPCVILDGEAEELQILPLGEELRLDKQPDDVEYWYTKPKKPQAEELEEAEETEEIEETEQFEE